VLKPLYKEDTPTILERFVRDSVAHAGAKGVVIGLSGGLDSCTVLAICAKAIGSKRVLSLHMPTDATPGHERRDAAAMARKVQVRMEVVPIEPAVESLSRLVGANKPEHRGNLKSRVRMAVLYHRARKSGCLVVGTGNKSELLTGYFTKFGDGASDINPLGDLYKTQVRALAKAVGIPKRIIEKPPTAALWDGQTDEGELGITYEMLDRILFGIELGMEDDGIAQAAGVPVGEVGRVRDLNTRSVHKRRLGLIPKLGARTVGNDWRE
jgi:NAD+ synthase